MLYRLFGLAGLFPRDVLEPSFPCGAQLRLLKNAGREALQGGVKPPHSKARLRRAKARTLKVCASGRADLVGQPEDSSGMDLPLNFYRCTRTSFDLEVEEVLQVEPELRIRIEVARQPQGGVRRDAATLVHDLTYARCRHVEVERQLVDREAERFHKVLAKHLAGDEQEA
jgi:hypothetical protein